MAYTTLEIINWAKIAQPLARIGEGKKRAKGDSSADVDLDIKLYITRKDVEYAYSQNADAAILFIMGNYLLSLMGVYLFTAQSTTGSGGSITPVNPSSNPEPYDFDVSASSFIVTGATSKVFPSSWIGYNILFVRGHITQSKVDNGVDTSYTWDRTTATLTLLNGAAQLGENLQIFPLI